MQNNKRVMNLEEKIIGDITGEFVIEAYQRGYRWSKDEIEHLLNDIDEIPDGQSYCLQPIVVKNNNGVYELIDGQQRLTTLYLIMKYLPFYQNLKYSIEYTTRKSENGHIGSKDLLENINVVDLNSPSSNIDELFIKKAYGIISNWFNNEDSKKISFYYKLQKFVTVIWYEVDSEEDSVSIFTRLNIGKISLTNAELVKALFLSKGKKDDQGVYAGNPYGIDDKKQHEIALQWDAMEKGLHDNKFWAFITNEKKESYPIRMELFFDIMENKPADECSFYTFNRFYDRFKISTNRTESWETIVRYYQQLWEWYKDFSLYHQIGYLVTIGYSIKDLLDIAMNKDNPVKKSEFKEEILKKIRQSVKFEDLDYADLSYEHHSYFIHILLLLFNVETIRQKGDEDNRFPFERYKNEGTWSLEHIHAQNSENLKTNREWRDWLVLHKRSLKSLIKTHEENSSEYQSVLIIINKIDSIISHIDDTKYKGSIRDEFSAIAPEVVNKLSDGNDKIQMHSLSNMALLTVDENAALNNSTFDVKRSKILDMDRNGDYIPTCTKNVFMKYYSSSDTKLHFWSEEDRKSYIEAMNDVLYRHKDTNGNEIKLIKEEIHYGNK